MSSSGMVYFVGAGPGDPDLITVKGRDLIRSADVLVYAGSLVQKGFLDLLSSKARAYNSAGMKLAEQVAVMEEAVRESKQVVRLHTGDPSVYGAIAEQMQGLKELGISYQVVPGVSSAFAAAAALQIEYTLPEETQTLILTRQSGRTKVPERESLCRLAAHQSSLVIFLSAGMIAQVRDEFLSAGYAMDTPVALVYRVTWPDEKVIRGTLADIAEKVLAAEITHHALIIISPALAAQQEEGVRSSHLYGTAQDVSDKADSTAIITLTKKSVQTGRRLLEGLENAVLYAPQKFIKAPCDDERIRPGIESVRQVLQSAFSEHKALICIMASGIVVRELAPLLRSKHVDPAVVVLDEAGRFAVSLLSGHKGGANALAKDCAKVLQGQAVLTTASDTQGLPAIDLLAQEYSWIMVSGAHLTEISAAMVNGEKLLICQDCGSRSWLPIHMPENFLFTTSLESMKSVESSAVICITYKDCRELSEKENMPSLVLHPKCLFVGLGCNRGTPAAEILQAVKDTFYKHGLAMESIAGLASLNLKADEAGLLKLSRQQNWPLKFYSAAELSALDDLPNPSETVKRHTGSAGVCEPAALLSSGASRLLVEKEKYQNVTVAVALKEED